MILYEKRSKKEGTLQRVRTARVWRMRSVPCPKDTNQSINRSSVESGVFIKAQHDVLREMLVRLDEAYS